MRKHTHTHIYIQYIIAPVAPATVMQRYYRVSELILIRNESISCLICVLFTDYVCYSLAFAVCVCVCVSDCLVLAWCVWVCCFLFLWGCCVCVCVYPPASVPGRWVHRQ